MHRRRRRLMPALVQYVLPALHGLLHSLLCIYHRVVRCGCSMCIDMSTSTCHQRRFGGVYGKITCERDTLVQHTSSNAALALACSSCCLWFSCTCSGWLSVCATCTRNSSVLRLWSSAWASFFSSVETCLCWIRSSVSISIVNFLVSTCHQKRVAV